MIPSQRELFDIPKEVAYFNCAYMGPLPKASVAAGQRGLADKSRPWSITTADFFTEVEQIRGLFAGLVNCRADDVALIPSVSYGIGLAAANLPVRGGQKIVVLEEQFPSNIYPWMAAAEKSGAELVTIPRPSDLDWTRDILAALDDDTAVAALPHCHWTDGSLIDLEAVGKRCRELGAALVVDGTQSVGAMPFDVQKIQPDFLIVAAYKWLLGAYSQGFVYAAPKWHQGAALEENWINRKDAENFAGLVDYKDSYEPGARRFDMGEKSNFLCTPATKASLEQITAWGVDNIAQSLGAFNAALSEQARALGLEPVAPQRRGPHLLGIKFPPGAAAKLAASLAEAKIFVSVRGDSMRIAPHLYNTPEDVERLLDQIKKA